MILEHFYAFSLLFYKIPQPNCIPNHRYLQFGYRKPKLQPQFFFCSFTATALHLKKMRYLRGDWYCQASLISLTARFASTKYEIPSICVYCYMKVKLLWPQSLQFPIERSSLDKSGLAPSYRRTLRAREPTNHSRRTPSPPIARPGLIFV